MRLDPRPVRREVLAALSQMPEVTKQVRKVASDIRRDARRIAPKKTGTLRRNIAVERVFDARTRSMHFLVGWTPAAWYGWLVESGTEDTTAHPHLVPAAIQNGAGRTKALDRDIN